MSLYTCELATNPARNFSLVLCEKLFWVPPFAFRCSLYDVSDYNSIECPPCSRSASIITSFWCTDFPRQCPQHHKWVSTISINYIHGGVMRFWKGAEDMILYFFNCLSRGRMPNTFAVHSSILVGGAFFLLRFPTTALLT